MSDDTAAPKPPVNSLRGLIPFLRPHRPLLASWLAALALSSGATLTLPVAVKYMIDEGFAAGNSVDKWFALMLVVAVALALATAARFYFVSLLGERVIADLRRTLYGHLLSLDQAFFEKTRTGELLSRLSADTELLRSVVGSSMSVALRSGITVVGSAVMLAVTSPRLALYALLGIPLVVLPMVLSGRRVRGVALRLDAGLLRGERGSHGGRLSLRERRRLRRLLGLAEVPLLCTKCQALGRERVPNGVGARQEIGQLGASAQIRFHMGQRCGRRFGPRRFVFHGSDIA